MNEYNNILKQWWNNKSVNPKSKRKIKQTGRVWKKFFNDSLKKNIMNDSYDKFHRENLDPLTKMELENDISYFKYKYCWSPLNGDILGIDIRGPLKFDPDILIHYFYVNRLKHLWVEPKNGYEGTYGDGLGNGPDFIIKGRGPSYHWYLFRLPIFDAYCDPNEIGQQTTLSPILNLKDITDIYNTAQKNGDNYKNIFGRDRPNILRIYELYHNSIQKPDFSNLVFGISEKEIKDTFTIMNMQAVNELRKL
jgi:hypothetical protein